MTLPPWFTPIPPAEPGQDADPRIYRAANDPAFPARREEAVAILRAAIDRQASEYGFVARGSAWVKTGPMGMATLYVLRSRYGWDVQVNLGFQPAEGPPTGLWAREDVLPLSEFLPAGSGPLAYLDILERPEVLDLQMQALARHALPWLCAHLTAADPPELADHLPRALG